MRRSKRGGPFGLAPVHFPPQILQSIRRASCTVRNRMSCKSNVSSRSASGSPMPVISLIASIAPRQPTVPETAPNTGKLPPPGRGRFRHAARQTGRLTGQNRRELAGQFVHGAIDHRLALPDALLRSAQNRSSKSGAQQTTTSAIRPAARRSSDVTFSGNGDDVEPRIQLAKPRGGAIDAGSAEGRVRHQELPIQIARLDGRRRGPAISRPTPAAASS